MKKVLMIVFLALMTTFLFAQFENSIITCSGAAVNVGEDFSITISTTELQESWSITAFQFELDFNPAIIEYSSFAAGDVIAGSGSLLANESEPGHIIVAFAHYQAISGEGNLVTINFSAAAVGNTVLDLNDFKYNATYLASGNLIDGNVQVTEYNPFQDVVITAGSGNVTVGNNIEIPITTTMLTTDMGAISFQFDLDFNPALMSFTSFALGNVPNPGNLIANESSPGVVSVAYANVMPITGEGTLCTLTFAAENPGTSDLDLNQFKYNSTYLYNLVDGSVEVMEYNPFQEVVITAGSADAAIGASIDIPITTTEVTTEMGAISFQFDLYYDNSILSYDGFAIGDVPNPGNLIANESSPGVISVAYANVMPITGEGSLCSISFIADAAGTSDLVLDQFKYNSTYLNNLVDGSVNVSAIQYPDWLINPPDYEYNASIWGIVMLDDVEVDVTTGMLGCFVGDECRGIASYEDGSLIDYTTPFGHIIFLPMVYSNVTSGETLEFLYFDAITQEVYPIAETMEFIADMVIGDGFDPFVFNASTASTIDVSKNMVAGWNWFSLNVTGDDMTTNGVLASLGNNATNIKSQTQSAIYYDGMGWFGSLSNLNNYTFYKLEGNNPATWEYSGIPLDLASTTYNLTSGWNWISYAPQQSEPINHALATITNGTNIKNQTQSAIYYEGMGWFGSLGNLLPLGGYMLQMTAAETFNYPEPRAELVASRTQEQISSANANNISRENYREPDWSINPPDFEYNGSIWGIVMLNGTEVTETTGIIGCFVDDECRGIASFEDGSVLNYIVPFGHVIFLPMVYSNVTSGETINFKYWDANTDMIFDVEETLEWQADMVVGDGFNPFVFTVETGGNLPPAANAGPDQIVTEGDLVTLDGSASSDPEGEALTFLWTAPDGIILDDATAVMPTFTAPEVDMDTDFVFSLVVNDGEFDSNPNEVVITVLNIWVYEESMITVGSDDVMELEVFQIPVTTSPLYEEWNVISFQFELNFDPEVLAFQECTMGDVPNPSMLLANEQEPGHISVAYANAFPISGEGSLCYLEFQAIGIGGSSTLDIYEFKYNQTYMTNLVDGLVNVTPLDNHAPEIMLPSTFSFITNQTLSVDFTDYIYDVDGDVLTLTATGNTNIMIDIDGYMVEMSAPADWTGSEIVTFTVDDGYESRDIASDDVEILVTLPEPVLEIDLPESLSLVTEAQVTIDFEEYIYYLNIDPATLTLSVAGNNDITVAIDGFEVTFTSSDWIGSEIMTFTVSDEARRISASDQVTVNVVNFANSILTVESITVDDGSDFLVAINTSIVDVSWNVISYQGKLNYDTNYLTWNGVTLDNTICGGTVLGNEIESGVISFAYMHYLNLTGEGPIVFFDFTAHGIGETNLHLWDFKYNSTYMMPENQIDGVITINDVGNLYVPIADAGEDQTVTGGDLVTLDASGSFDMNGDDLTYAWTAPVGITLSNPAAVMPTFTAPVNTTIEEYVFILVVSDIDGDSDPDEVTITVVPPNMPPVADAGDDVSVWENLTVMLDGSDSYDPDGDDITFLWTAPGLTFDDPTSATPIVTAPEVDDDTQFTVTLTVNDGFLDATDNLIVTVMNVTIPLNPPSNLAVENLDDGQALFTWSPPATGDPLEEGFETWPPDGWILLDEDGDGYMWDDGGELGLDAHTGDGLAYSASFLNPPGPGALNPDNWLISPAVTLGGSGTVSYFVCAQDAAWAAEHYGVYISDSGTDPEDFDLLFEETLTARSTGRIERNIPKGSRDQGAWYERNVEIDGYNGACYIAFRHYNCTDMFYLDLDDVTITPNMSASRDLLGYNVYLDGVMQNTNLVTNTQYTFTGLVDGDDYEAGVVAVYDEGYSVMATLDFTYIANQAPIADAGSDRTVRDGLLITLDGSDSYDPDGDPLTYAWTAPAGITLSNPAAAMPTFIAPEVDEMAYTFTLVVSDGEYSDSDTVVITVKDDEPGNVSAVHLANPAYVQLTWEAPDFGGEVGEWIHYDNGMNDDGIGLTNGGSFAVAARWAAGDLDEFDGMQITKMSFFPRGVTTAFTLKVWTGANAANEVLSQPVTPVNEQWNEVYFTTPITIDADTELWVGYDCANQPAEEYPAGCDAGPAVAGFGDMISMGGGAWAALSGYGLDFNWNIQAWVAGADRPLPLASNNAVPVPGSLESERSDFVCGNLDPAASSLNRAERLALLGFNVYLDEELHEEGLDADETSYIFMNMSGNHAYGVAAVFDDGISEIVSVEINDNDEDDLPLITTLAGNYPNPFNPETTIKLAVHEAGQVTLDIYNVRGQKIRSLINGHLDAGNHDIVWNGIDDKGNSVGSGVYFYNMKFGKYSSTKKMILMK